MAMVDRRTFLKTGGAVAAGTAFGSGALRALAAGAVASSPAPTSSPTAGSYGSLQPVADQNGDEILALPAGFTYTTFSKTGALMTDGNPVPRNHDGMAAFVGPAGAVRLIRNHEVRNAPGVSAGAVLGPAGTKYDALGVGGTVTVDYDPRTRRVAREFVSINGTIVNCAGGIASSGGTGWITSEETTAGPTAGWAQKHGYNFFVPASANGPVPAVALTAMGRFAHEAVATDPATGIIFQTEDSGNTSGFYRFLPSDRNDLTAGGTLEMLGIAGRPGFSGVTGQTVGVALPVTWVPIADPDPNLEGGAPRVSTQGVAGGAAVFNRLEGIWFDRITRTFFFNSTSGGDARYGQVWQYDPRRETLTLLRARREPIQRR